MTHVGYYVNSEILEDFFADLKKPVEDHMRLVFSRVGYGLTRRIHEEQTFRFARGCFDRTRDIIANYQELSIDEVECVALVAVTLFTISTAT